MFERLLRRRSPESDTGEILYRAVVAQARLPVLYARFGVPDTVDGRFEMIVLHLVLVMRRLETEGDMGKALTQRLFDAFVLDMDRSVRELGAGDLAVPRRMKVMGRAFYGRLESYGRALREGDRPGLQTSLSRNLFPGGNPEFPGASLADYGFRAAQTLAAQPASALDAGRVGFPDPGDEPLPGEVKR